MVKIKEEGFMAAPEKFRIGKEVGEGRKGL
jgi:hypothetical protein